MPGRAWLQRRTSPRCCRASCPARCSGLNRITCPPWWPPDRRRSPRLAPVPAPTAALSARG